MAVNGLAQTAGYDAVLVGNIPGGGMSRSASLCINLILTGLEVSGLELEEEFDIINFSQAVENDYTGSPCGQLDQIMIYYAKEGMGTHYNPADNSIKCVSAPTAHASVSLCSPGSCPPVACGSRTCSITKQI